MEKRPFFRAATAGLGKYSTGGYGRIGVYRVNPMRHSNQLTSILNHNTLIMPVTIGLNRLLF